MSTQYSSGRSRRSPGRSDRRSNRRDRHSTSSQTGSHTPKKQKSLLEKIVGFFRGTPSRQSPPVVSSQSPARSSESNSRRQRPTGMRKPEVVEVTSGRLYVGNLSFDAVESDLTELFSGVGTVQNVEIVMNRHTMRSKGFAFVQMQSLEEAQRAVTELHDKEYMGGRKLVVSGAKAIEERRSERSSSPEE